MHDFRRPRPCCTHGCFPALEPILSPTRELRRSKKLLPRHFHYPPPDGLRPAQITATIAAFSWPRTNPFAAYPFTVTRANRRTDLLLPVGQPPALWSEQCDFRIRPARKVSGRAFQPSRRRGCGDTRRGGPGYQPHLLGGIQRNHQFISRCSLEADLASSPLPAATKAATARRAPCLERSRSQLGL